MTNALATSLAGELRPRFVRLAHLLRRHAAQQRISLSQSAVLGLLLDGRPQRVSQLAAAEQVTLPTMTQLVARMEALGWVERSASPADRRGVEVRITERGREVAETVTGSRTALLDERLARLSPAERQALAAALPALDRLVQP